MRHRLPLCRGALAALCVVATVASAAAQVGRIGGTVKDEAGQPLKGATVTAENPDASPNSFTATTDDKGRFSIIGLRSGAWVFTAQAPGFAPEAGRMNVQSVGAPNPPLTFALKKGAAAAAGALAGINAKDLQAELVSADLLYNSQRWDESIAAYRAIVEKAPSVTSIHLQIAAACRNKKDYDCALAAYNNMLKVDATNDKALVGIGMTNLEKGDMEAADTTLTKAAGGPNPTREVFYNLGEVKFAKGHIDEAAAWYERSVAADPTWGRPVLKLALVAVNKGDKTGAIALAEKAMALDPRSPDAATAAALIEQLKK
jgi:tetratricopeptide (TPR) repeat protein